MKKCFLTIILIIFLVSFINPLSANSYENTKYTIVIDINELTLSVIDTPTLKTIKKYPIAIGSKDTPSPIGIWRIKSKAIMKGPYGGYWLGLNAPWDTFGIHGTSRPSSIGSLASGGCIRMYNENIRELFNIIEYNTKVIITAGASFRFSPYARTIMPNNRGTDVYEVQRRLRDLGYYNGELTGIYEYSLQIAILKYKHEFNLGGTYEINDSFLDHIGLIKFE